jgi:hypothetical protein
MRLPDSLSRAFEEAGFEVLNVEEVYGSQFLQIAARPRGALPASDTRRGDDSPGRQDACAPRELEDLVKSFADTFRERAQGWRDRLAGWRREGRRAVLWGAGSKGVTFLNTFRDLRPADYAVDLNPRKHGRFLPGCGVEIVASEFLLDLKPDLILIANPLYEDEIRGTVADMGLSGEFAVI